ncbi:twin arginine-targeting protein translocase TatB [Erythrobacter sp. QSSC1-22B]|uniref:Sec-independent protein translocase protein TatB n=1 Tax=Erythrobacter sp. QSSC1-22B TaxID=1860125 RepID=UPI000805803A|nr:Sec-independent protein translocase protein TatB [Erythrobacter sp. QSSC1-22B]OBX19120.1 twin arginine-targeting protein translocase TatB [Erythrobacter sp. QSSC1-22B]
MFDIGASELLVIVIVAILVIGPKEMPRALRTAGRWIGKMRRMSAHFRSGIDTMIREAELEDAEKEWRERNDRIMAESSGSDVPPAMEPLPQQASSKDAAATDDYDARAEAAIARARPKGPAEDGSPTDPTDAEQPSLPLDPAGSKPAGPKPAAPKKDG